MARIVVLADYFVPASNAGGPVVSIGNVLDDLRGHRIIVLTRDRDLGSREPYPPPFVGQHRIDHAIVTYLPPPRRPRAVSAWSRALRALVRADVVYVNSLHSPWFSIVPALVMRLTHHLGTLVIAPRGELSPGALAFNPRRKRLWHRSIRRLRLDLTTGSGDVRWIASSDVERDDIARVFPRARIYLTQVRLRDVGHVLPTRRREPDTPFALLYLGRVVPKKGLLDLVRGLALVRTPVTLRIVGNLEDGNYVEQVRAACHDLPDHVRVDWVGPVSGAEVGDYFRSADGFALLTRGENFGHAIGEALAHGVPVILSDQTPWTYVEAQGAGVVIAYPGAQPPDATVIAARLDVLLRATPESWQAMREAAFDAGRRGLVTSGAVEVTEAFGLSSAGQ